MSDEYIQLNTHKVQNKSRHTGSDGLRVFALLGVMAFHIRPDLVPGGFLGVVIFLVLAGYYTTRSFVVRPRINLPGYYKSRITRLWPPLLFLVASLAIFSGFFLPEVFRFLQGSAPSAVLGYHNIAEILADKSYFARHGSFDPLTHLWALSLEMQYYLVYPLLFSVLSALGDRLPSKLRLYSRELAGYFLLLLGIGSAVYMGLNYVPGGDPTPYYYNSLMRVHAFMNGAATSLILAGRQMRQAYLVASGQVWDDYYDENDHTYSGSRSHRKPRPMPLAIRTAVGWISLILMLASFFLFDANSSFLYRGGFYLYSILAVLFIAFAGVRAVPGMGFMETGLFRYLASRSYHIYLWQYAIMICLEAALRFSTLAFLPRLAIQLLLLAALAEVSWRLFEEKGTIRAGFRNSLALAMSCILIVLLIIPPLSTPSAPALEGDVVLKAIQANHERQSQRLNQGTAEIDGQVEAQESEKSPAAAGDSGNKDAAETEKTTESSLEASSSKAEENQASPDTDTKDTTEDTGETENSAGESEAVKDNTGSDAEAEDNTGDTANSGQEANAGASGEVTTSNPYGYSEAAVNALKDLNLLIVGDSVMAMAIPGIEAYVPGAYIDAEVSRHFFQGPDIIQSLDNSGLGAEILVVALATNGDINPPDLDTYYAVANGRPLIFVNTIVPNTWEQPNNQKLANFASQNSNVYVADWYGRAKNVAEYFYQDATHPVPEGADVYDQVILETILSVLGVQP